MALPKKIGDPHAEQVGGVVTPLSRAPRTFDVSTAFLSPRVLQCLQAAIPPGPVDSTMTEKSVSGAALDKSAKSKAGGDAGRDARAKDSPAAAVKSETTGSGSHSSPKKRRKVNHGTFPLRAACDRDRCSEYWFAWRSRQLFFVLFLLL